MITEAELKENISLIKQIPLLKDIKITEVTNKWDVPLTGYCVHQGDKYRFHVMTIVDDHEWIDPDDPDDSYLPSAYHVYSVTKLSDKDKERILEFHKWFEGHSHLPWKEFYQLKKSLTPFDLTQNESVGWFVDIRDEVWVDNPTADLILSKIERDQEERMK